jgi:hypothetical protein
MTKQLTLGTAAVTKTQTGFEVRWMNIGSFLVGEQTFGNLNHALRFVRERGLRVIECQVA